MVANELDVRYGRSRERRRRNRVISFVAALLAAAAVVGWAVWAGILTPTVTLETSTLGYEVVDDDEVLVQFEVSATPGTPLRCALEAQSENHAVVGWRVFDLPASEEYTRRFAESLTTSEPAVVGLISACTLA